MIGLGTQIGDRYELLDALARGGQGFVYKARDRKTEKLVALKLVGAEVAADPDTLGRLMLEARVAGRAKSENIVDVSDVGVDAETGCAFLVMELLSGRDLEQLVRQDGPCRAEDAAEYLRQVASGLDKAHAYRDARGTVAPIIHRDLKPGNLFLTRREDGKPLIKILDFGLAKQLAASSCVSMDIKGTPLYMAPEQLSPSPVTPATDVWALGLIAFFLLTGRIYWRAGQGSERTYGDVFAEVLGASRESPSTRLKQWGAPTQLSPAFDAWFLRCVEREPSSRFQTAGDAIGALHSALDLRQTDAQLPGPIAIWGERPEVDCKPHSGSAERRVTVTLQPVPNLSPDVRSLAPRVKQPFPRWRSLPWIVGTSLGVVVGGVAGSVLLAERRANADNPPRTEIASAPTPNDLPKLSISPTSTSAVDVGLPVAVAGGRPAAASTEHGPPKKAAGSLPKPRMLGNATTSRATVGQPTKTRSTVPSYPWSSAGRSSREK